MGLLASDSDEPEIKLKGPNLQLGYTPVGSIQTVNSFTFVILCGFPLPNCPECVMQSQKPYYYSK